MQPVKKHTAKTIYSTIAIHSRPETVWDNITNVKIEEFPDPKVFRLLGIPKPLRADLLVEGTGGQRVAYFDSGKRFIQEITIWKPLKEYAFNFNPEKGFRVGYLFDISDGVFRVPKGSYAMTFSKGITTLQLATTYSIDKRIFWLLNIPVRLILLAFQKYLLTSIKKK